MIDAENQTIDARTLASMLDMTPRNISHLIDSGMPVYERGKAGKGHVFKLAWSMYWHAGWSACREWREKVPGALATVLVGYALDNDYPEFSFSTWMKRAKSMAVDLPASAVDVAAAR